jgi:hypothetical protein
MKKQFEASFSLVSSLSFGMSLGAALTALTMFSACNSHSTSNAVPITTGGTATPQPTTCPAWGCGNPPIVIVGNPDPQPTAVEPQPPVACPLIEGGCAGPIRGPVFTSSQDTDTKDVDLQRAEIQDQNMNNRASAIADKFGMDFGSAHQLAVLADRVQTLNAQGSVSADDEQGVIQAAMGIAGLSQDEINSAITQSLQGDDHATNSLMEKAAQNLGMSSTAVLRDQLLPALGISN